MQVRVSTAQLQVEFTYTLKIIMSSEALQVEYNNPKAIYMSTEALQVEYQQIYMLFGPNVQVV